MEVFLGDLVCYAVTLIASTVSCALAVFFGVQAFRRRKLFAAIFSLTGVLFAAAFLFKLWDQLYVEGGITSATLETIGLFFLALGIFMNPEISELALAQAQVSVPKIRHRERPSYAKVLFGVAMLLGAAGVAVWAVTHATAEYYPLHVVATALSLLLVGLHVRHMQKDPHPGGLRKLALLLLGTYVLFVVRHALSIAYDFTETRSVLFETLTVRSGVLWHAIHVVTAAAFLCLWFWAWTFIKHQRKIRIFIFFLFASSLFSAVGATLFTVYSIKGMEQQELALVQNAAQTQRLLLEQRLRSALFLARLIGNDAEVLQAMGEGDYTDLYARARTYAESDPVDMLRIYNRFGEVFVSPTDTRDEHVLFASDPLLSYVLIRKTQVQSFDVQRGVLAPVITARALYPLMKDGTLYGAVEVAYLFDNAFVDYLKSVTGMDATLFTGAERSATTLVAGDGVSRWVGSIMTDADVQDRVLVDGTIVAKSEFQLGEAYAAAYLPIRQFDGTIIGMIADAHKSSVFLGAIRDRLASGFFVTTFGSFGIMLVCFGLWYGILRVRTWER